MATVEEKATVRHSNIGLEWFSDYAKAGNVYDQNRDIIDHKWLMGKIRDCRAKGYQFFPTCDNVDPQGKCKGHEKES